jgi:bis(5'-nucleosidyl)-tetraphosphatase
MKKIQASGVLLFNQNKEFLILYKFSRNRDFQNRDLPKGHLEIGESLLEAAKRELREETGISENLVFNEEFIYENTYYPRYKR